MTGPHSDTRDAETRPISVAELLARNGNIGSPPVTGRRRRRRGNSNAVTVAELTGEIPIIRDEDLAPDRDTPAPAAPPRHGGAVRADTPPAERPDRDQPAAEWPDRDQPAAEWSDRDQPAAPTDHDRPAPVGLATVDWSEPGPRWPKSMPEPRRSPGPEPSPYPRPSRRSELPGTNDDQPGERPATGSGAEQMSPDPFEDYADVAVDVLQTESFAEVPADDSTDVRSPLRSARKLFGRLRGGTAVTAPAGPADDEDLSEAGPIGPAGLDDDHTDIEADLTDAPVAEDSRWSELLGGGMIVAQSVLAVVFGAGLFIAFDQLWRWNDIVALVLTVLVTLGLVAAVQAVRRTVDVGSTLTAVAVGLLITLGPLALHAN